MSIILSDTAIKQRAVAVVDDPPDDCAYCGKPVQGNYSIHRDGFGEGPEVDLCDDCGKDPLPTCEDIWDRISVLRRATHLLEHPDAMRTT